MANTLFYSPIGNVGKSTIAYTFYDYQKIYGKQHEYHTNDLDNAVFDIPKLIPNHHKIIKHGEKIIVNDEKSTIFDCGGYLDNRIIDITEYVDNVVLVTTYMSKKEITPVIKMINTLKPYNEKIIVVLNNTSLDKRKEGKEIFSIALEKYNIPLFMIIRSNYFTRLANFNLSIYDVCKNDRAGEGQIKKNIFPQLHKLFNLLS